MSVSVDGEFKRAQKLTSAKKKLKQFRASRSGGVTSPESTTSRSSSTSSSHYDTNAATTMPRRLPSYAKNVLAECDDTDTEGTIKLDGPPTPTRAHRRTGSRAHSHQRNNSSFSWPRQPLQSAHSRPTVKGIFDLPSLDHYNEEEDRTEAETLPSDSDHTDREPREMVTTPATPPGEDSHLGGRDESVAIARLSSFSFGAKPSGSALREPIQIASPSRPSASRNRMSGIRLSNASPIPFDFGGNDSLSLPRPASTANSPQRKVRHSHNRSESISLPNLKLGRPASLGLPSPGFPSTPSSPVETAAARSRPTSSNRLKFEPSLKEKEESRRRALEKLTGVPTPVEEPKSQEIMLPAFDDDDDMSTSSSRPPSGVNSSTASSSRPSSLIVTASSSGSGSSTSAWPMFEESDRWSGSFSQRFEPAKEEPLGFGFDLSAANKTSSVLLNCSLGVLTEEDETESDEIEDTEAARSITSPVTDTDYQTDVETAPAGPTPSRLRELHLLSSVSSQGSNRRASNPEVLQTFARAQSRETPTKSYNNLVRGGRPRGIDSASFTPSPVKGTRPKSLILRGVSRSSISYRKDDSGGSASSRDYSSSRGQSPPPPSDVTSPTTTSPLADFHTLARGSNRQCPRPRSMIGISGASGRVLGEVDETDEEGPTYDDSMSVGASEASRDSYDDATWRPTARRDSRDRIDAEMERDALKEDVELWRKRCRGLEDRLETERRETITLRERVRKLGDRLLTVSATHSLPSPTVEAADPTQSRLIAEMRDQLFSLTAALERERKEKQEAISHAAELQAAIDLATTTPHVSPLSLPETPKSRPRVSSLMGIPPHAMTPPAARYADADTADTSEDESYMESAQPRHDPDDPNLFRMKGFAFPNGPVNGEKSSRESKRESFFGLSRARVVRAAPSESGPSLGWAQSPVDDRFDLPPFVVDDNNKAYVTPVSPRRSTFQTARAAPPATRTTQRHSPSQQPTPQATPERQTTGFGLSFLTGYLSLPRATPPVNIPRIAITPSSVSPSKSRVPLPESLEYRPPSTPLCDLDFRHSCKRCTGEIIEL